MENNLSKAISQIKFPVRYDEEKFGFYDAENKRITVEQVAEMINGMGEHLPDTGKVIKECSHPSWAMKRIGGGEMCHKCGKIWGS